MIREGTVKHRRISMHGLLQPGSRGAFPFQVAAQHMFGCPLSFWPGNKVDELSGE